MRYVNTLVAVIVMVSAAVVQAQSPVLPVQGTLRSTAGDLINEDQTVTFRLYNDRTGGEAFWEVEKLVTFRMGQFVAYLGDAEPIDPVDFEGLPEVWLGIQVAPETVEMSPRVRLGTSPFALYAQMCGEATTAVTASSATTATTASTANDLNCSGCVGQAQLDSATNNRIDAAAGDVNCSGCVDSGDIDQAVKNSFADSDHSHPSTDVAISPSTARTNNGQIFFGTTAGGCITREASFCALTAVQYRDGNQAGDSFCNITIDGSSWTLCARGNGSSNGAFCSMACIP